VLVQLTLSKLCKKVKVTCSLSQDEHIATVVGATSSEGFLASFFRWTYVTYFLYRPSSLYCQSCMCETLINEDGRIGVTEWHDPYENVCSEVPLVRSRLQNPRLATVGVDTSDVIERRNVVNARYSPPVRHVVHYSGRHCDVRGK